MVKRSRALDTTFAALADPTRRAILARLAQAPGSSVGELARPFAMSLPAISKHLAVLENAGLLARRKDGRIHHCRLVAAPMQTASAWIAHYSEFWESRLDALERFLAGPGIEKGQKRWKRRHADSRSRGRSGPRGKGFSARGPTPN